MIGWILLGIILLIIVAYFVIALIFHNSLFNKRFEKDPLVKYYDISMFDGFMKQEISFNYLNGKINGYIYSYPDHNKGLLVLSHGMFSNHEAYLQEIEYFARNGYKVLGFDYYGTSLSDGDKLRGLGSSLACLDFVLKQVYELKLSDKVYVFGHSWGGFASLMIAKYHPNLDGIITMSPFIKGANLLENFIKPYLYPAIFFFMLIDRIKTGKYAYDNGIDVLNNSNVKTLVIHSKDDHMVRYYSNTYLLTEYVKKDNVKYLILNKKRHNPDYSLQAIEYGVEVNSKLRTLKGNDLIEYKKNIDYQLLGKLDEDIMKKIVDFLGD